MNLRNLFRRRSTPDGIPLAEEVDSVKGERSMPFVNRMHSTQTRVANAMILGLVCVVGIAFLSWYYITQVGKLGDADKAQKAALAKRASGDQKFPALGRVEPPRPVPPKAASSAQVAMTSAVFGGAPPPLPDMQATTPAPRGAPPAAAVSPPTSAPKTAAQIERELKLAGPVMKRSAAPQQPTTASALLAAADGANSTKTTAVANARFLGDRRFLATKGTLVDCTLRTAIDSTIPGMVLCVGATDVYSADGSVILLERGTQYVGETKGGVKQGQSRVGVIWTEATTPVGIRVTIDSPGTDALGRAGLEGWTDNHFWDRFGAAIMLTLIDSSVYMLAAGRQNGSGNTTVAMNPTSTTNIAEEALKNTVGIEPTVRIAQGERIQILFNRDLRFPYELRASKE
jgi:type IV secretion system protein VirB10